jgi:hypothetical protein
MESESERRATYNPSKKARAGLLVLVLLGVAAVANLKFHLGLVGGYDRIAVAGIFIAMYVALLRLGAFTKDLPRLHGGSRRKGVLTVALATLALWFFELAPYLVNGQAIPSRSWLLTGGATVVIAFVTSRVLRSSKDSNE